jgi:hypothetical protein
VGSDDSPPRSYYEYPYSLGILARNGVGKGVDMKQIEKTKV